MRNVRTQYPKSLRYEIVRVYLTGNNSYEELANILIPNFASDSILCCKHFQENVNETRNAVNDVRKTVNLSSKTTVAQLHRCSVALSIFYIAV